MIPVFISIHILHTFVIALLMLQGSLKSSVSASIHVSIARVKHGVASVGSFLLLLKCVSASTEDP